MFLDYTRRTTVGRTPLESYRLCYVVVCDLETLRIGAPYIYDISSLRVNKFGLMNEWKLIPHDDKQKEYNMIQHTAHNNQFPLDIINTFNKRKSRGWLQIENQIRVDFIHVC